MQHHQNHRDNLQSSPLGRQSKTPLQFAAQNIHEQLDCIECDHSMEPSNSAIAEISLRSLLHLAKETGVRITIEPL